MEGQEGDLPPLLLGQTPPELPQPRQTLRAGTHGGGAEAEFEFTPGGEDVCPEDF